MPFPSAFPPPKNYGSMMSYNCLIYHDYFRKSHSANAMFFMSDRVNAASLKKGKPHEVVLKADLPSIDKKDI